MYATRGCDVGERCQRCLEPRSAAPRRATGYPRRWDPAPAQRHRWARRPEEVGEGTVRFSAWNLRNLRSICLMAIVCARSSRPRGQRRQALKAADSAQIVRDGADGGRRQRHLQHTATGAFELALNSLSSALAPNVAGRPQRCAWPPSTSALPRTGTKSRPKVRSCPPRSAAPQMTGRACTCLLPSRNPVELRDACRA